MTRQHCHECGTEVPVDDLTGLCHVGHRVNSPTVQAGRAPGPAAAEDEPAPWVATVDDDEVAPRRDPDPAAPPPPATALGSATTPPPGAGFRPDASAADLETPDVDAPVPGLGGTDAVAEAIEDADPSLEELAAMAAMAPGDDQAADDLASLSEDLRADLSAPASASAPTPAPAPTAPHVEEFDLDSLEQAVADLGSPDAGSASTPPAPPAPAVPAAAPAAAAGPSDGFEDLMEAAEDIDGSPDEPADEPADDHADEPVTIRPDHEAVPSTAGPGTGAPIDPTNFTASGRKVSSTSGGGGDEGLVGKLKGLFSR